MITIQEKDRIPSAWKITVFTIVGVLLSFILLIGYRGFARFDPNVITWYVVFFHVTFIPAFVLVRRKYLRMGGAFFSFIGGLILGYLSGFISYIASIAIVDNLIVQLEKLIDLHGFILAITINLSIPLWLMSWFSGGIASITVTVLLSIIRRTSFGGEH